LNDFAGNRLLKMRQLQRRLNDSVGKLALKLALKLVPHLLLNDSAGKLAVGESRRNVFTTFRHQTLIMSLTTISGFFCGLFGVFATSYFATFTNSFFTT
jgi:hypothetical protein